MNEKKDWSYPAMTENDNAQHFATVSPVEHAYPQQFPHGVPVHPPIHHPSAPPSNNYLVQGKPEPDQRLVSAPRPPSPGNEGPYTAAFHASPYLALGRKRARGDSLFPPESGPFFSSTKMFDNLYALDRTTLLVLRIQSKMDRGFFLADNDWTCYRRNYFQVSSAFSIHGAVPMYPDSEPQYLVRSSDGAFHNVRRFLLGISAHVSGSDKKIDLVQHTPKRDKGPQMVPTPKPIVPGGNLSMSAVSTSQSIVTFERIQFKTATANNGKRRAAQQYYVCVTDLYAETDEGNQIKVAFCQSAPLVVRGRSPGHYADSQEHHVNSPTTSAPPTPSASQPHHRHPPAQHAGNYDDRFHQGMPRPPYTPPTMMTGEYGSPYPYYTNYASFGHPMHASLPHPMMMNSAPSTPTPQQSHLPQASQYMMANGASSQSSSPHMYGKEFNNAQHTMNDPKLHMPMDEWQRPQLQSPQQEHSAPYYAQGTPVLSSATPQNGTFSPTTPTTPYDAARKFNSVPNICNQPTSS